MVIWLGMDKWMMVELILILAAVLDSIVLHLWKVGVVVVVDRYVAEEYQMQVVAPLVQSTVDTNGDSRKGVVGTMLIELDESFVTRNYRQSLA